MRNRKHRTRAGRNRARRCRTIHDLCVAARLGRADDEDTPAAGHNGTAVEEAAPPEEEPFWDFRRDGVNHDLLATFLSCRETCRLMFQEGWTSRLVCQPKEFQQALRWCLWKARGTGLTSPLQLARRYDRLWAKHTRRPLLDEVVKQQQVLNLVPTLLCACFNHWAEDLVREWVAVSANRPVPWAFPDGQVTKIRARVAAFRDTEEGGWWVEDSYLGVHLDPKRFEAEARFNLRTLVLLYVWREATGKQPAGIAYNVVNRASHFWPRDADGIEHFRKTLSKHRERCMHRVKVPIPRRTLDKMVQGVLAPIMSQIRDWAQGKDNYPNVLGDPDDRDCKGTPMYRAIVHRDFNDCYRRKAVFPPTLVVGDGRIDAGPERSW